MIEQVSEIFYLQSNKNLRTLKIKGNEVENQIMPGMIK
jgi:hypothetical protein